MVFIFNGLVEKAWMSNFRRNWYSSCGRKMTGGTFYVFDAEWKRHMRLSEPRRRRLRRPAALQALSNATVEVLSSVLRWTRMRKIRRLSAWNKKKKQNKWKSIVPRNWKLLLCQWRTIGGLWWGLLIFLWDKIRVHSCRLLRHLLETLD